MDDVVLTLRKEFDALTQKIKLAKCDGIDDALNRADLHRKRLEIIRRIEQATKQRGKHFKI